MLDSNKKAVVSQKLCKALGLQEKSLSMHTEKYNSQIPLS